MLAQRLLSTIRAFPRHRPPRLGRPPQLRAALLLCTSTLVAPCVFAEQAEKPVAPPAAAAPAAAAAVPPATTPAAPGQKPANEKPAATPAAPKAPAVPVGPAVVTIYDETIAGPVTAIEKGELTIGVEPPRRVTMDEVATVYLGNAPVLAASWIGQDGRDAAQVGGAPAKANGVQDIHLHLSGLRAGQPIKQITVIFQHPKRRALWRLDPSKSPAWRLVMEKAPDAQQAELYLEPNELDAFEQRFGINVIYGDDQTAKVELTASTHTDHQLKAGAQAAIADGAPAGPLEAIVYARDRGQVKGALLELTDESITLRTSWAKELKLPLVRVSGIRFPAVNASDAAQKFEARLAEPGKEDAALVLGKEQGLSLVTGTAHGLTEGKLSFTFEGEKRLIGQARLAGLVFAEQPKRRPSADPYQIVRLLNGDQLAGACKAANDQTLEFELSWGGEVALPRSAVDKIEFRNGKVTFLSDLDPVSVEEVPYFSRKFPYRRDQAFDGGPLKLKDKTYPKGLAVHSRSALAYGVDGQYASFKALVGFDPSAAGRGRVALRVLGDGRELFVSPDLRGTAEPLPLDVPIEGVKELTLVIDFGEEEDSGDRVIWAEPRVFRAGKGAESKGAGSGE